MKHKDMKAEITNNTDALLFVEERQSKLLEYINAKGKGTVLEMCAVFSVSSSTIRNDLRDLENMSLITRTHGGAIKITRTRYEPLMDERAQQNHKAKAIIAEIALEMIEDGDTIILDTGTTVLELARLLHRKKNITVLTNDIIIAAELEHIPSCEIFLIGGLLRKGFHCTVGCVAYPQLDVFSVDKAFLGTNAFSATKGASAPDISQSEIKRYMISIAAKIFMLCDHTKLETNAFMSFASTLDVDVLITDCISKELYKTYEQKNIKVYDVNYKYEKIA